MSAKIVEIYTDGACRGNPGPGGWGASLRFNGQQKDLYGSEAKTTNNRMELMAVIQALETLSRPCAVKVYTDSKYVLDGMTKWLPNWKKKAGRPRQKNRLKMLNYGNGWMLLCRQMTLAGNGLKGTKGMMAMNMLICWRTAA